MRIMGWCRAASLQTGIACLAIGMASTLHAATIGIHFQTNRGGYGPYSIANETPASAFGVTAADWYEPGVSANGAGQFKAVDFTWSSYPGTTPGIAYGWTHANQPGVPAGGDPLTGEDVVLSSFLFAAGVGEYAAVPDGAPIIVSLAGLERIAKLSAGYTVKLTTSSEWTVDSFTPALVTDNATNSETVPFALLPDRPLWWTGAPWESSGGVGTSSMTFFGDTLTIKLEGRNEQGSRDNRPYQRTSLGGVIIEYTPIPEPSAGLLGLAGLLAASTLRRRG